MRSPYSAHHIPEAKAANFLYDDHDHAETRAQPTLCDTYTSTSKRTHISAAQATPAARTQSGVKPAGAAALSELILRRS